MSKKAIIVTGGSGYILKNFNFHKFQNVFDIFFIRNRKEIKEDISYEIEDLEILFSEINNNLYDDILFISFGSHLGGDDPGLYFKSIENIKKVIIYLNNTKKNIYIYHASSFSIFNPNKNCSLFSFLNRKKIDLRGAYSFSKKEQNKVITKFTLKNKRIRSKLVHIGHVYDDNHKLINLFRAKSKKISIFVFSILYSPFKLINPTSVNVIHNDINSFIKNYKKESNRIVDYPLTDKKNTISLFRIFLKDKLLFISPIPIFVCTLSPLILSVLPRHSNLSYLLKKYMQMNNSVKL